MTFSQSVNTVLRQKYASFTGRASRSEYWWFTLFYAIVALVLMALFMATGGGAWLQSMIMIGETGEGNFAPLGAFSKIIMALYMLFIIAIIVPSIAVAVRRLHDRNLSGWWLIAYVVASIIPFISLIVSIVFIVIFALKGTDGENKYGADPLG